MAESQISFALPGVEKREQLNVFTRGREVVMIVDVPVSGSHIGFYEKKGSGEAWAKNESNDANTVRYAGSFVPSPSFVLEFATANFNEKVGRLTFRFPVYRSISVPLTYEDDEVQAPQS